MNKKNLSERDICTKYITPALEQAGWDKMEQIREEVSFTDIKGSNIKGKHKGVKSALDSFRSYPSTVGWFSGASHSPIIGFPFSQ